MTKRYTQVPLGYLEPIFEDWRSVFDKGDLVNVFFMPNGDILFRALQFVDWMNDSYKEAVKIINFETELVLNPENLREVLNKYGQDKVLLLAKREFLQPDGVLMASVLEEFYARYGKGMLIFHEGFPIELEKYASNPVMRQKNLVHKIYPKPVISDYLSTTAQLFGVEVNDQLREEIVDYCAGIPWLINDVLRRVDDQDLFENDTFKWKVEQIAQAIPNMVGIERDLREFGLKDVNGQWIPVLHDYFTERGRAELEISDTGITWKGRDLSPLFSPGERRILAKLRAIQGVMRREEIGQLFWQERVNEEYTDWALDAIMSRLRKKIKKIGLPIVVKTRRGQGYECI